MSDFDQSTSTPQAHHRHPLGDMWLRSVAERRWWATTFTRQSVMDALRNLAWVAPLTILIWIYAEREQVGTPTYNDVPVQVTGPNLYVTPPQARVSLELKGPQSGLERIQLAIGKPPGLEIDLGNTPARGRQQINVIEQIQNLPLFRNTGVSVTKANPADLDVNIDEFDDVNVDVQNSPGVTNLESTTHYEPRSVRVRAPKALLDQWKKQGQLTVYADVEGAERLSPGQHTQIVAVSVPQSDPHVTIDPPSVKAFLDVRSSDETEVIPSMVIWIKAPQNILNDYDITQVPKFVPNTTVTGPPAVLKQFEANPPIAVLTITGDDINHEQPKQLEYQLPAGVTVSPLDQTRTFEFKLQRRSS